MIATKLPHYKIVELESNLQPSNHHSNNYAFCKSTIPLFSIFILLNPYWDHNIFPTSVLHLKHWTIITSCHIWYQFKNQHLKDETSYLKLKINAHPFQHPMIGYQNNALRNHNTQSSAILLMFLSQRDTWLVVTNHSVWWKVKTIALIFKSTKLG
jgi:hypothetical protein